MRKPSPRTRNKAGKLKPGQVRLTLNVKHMTFLKKVAKISQFRQCDIATRFLRLAFDASEEWGPNLPLLMKFKVISVDSNDPK